MININEYLLSKKKTKLNDLPKAGRKAYDEDGDEWNIIDVCSCADKEDLKEFFYIYGASEDVDLDKYPDDDYLVAAENGEYITIFWWGGEGGLHYK